jgi:hypothetical protein
MPKRAWPHEPGEWLSRLAGGPRQQTKGGAGRRVAKISKPKAPSVAAETARALFDRRSKELEEAWQHDHQYVETLPEGRLKDWLKDDIRKFRLIAEFLDTLPADDPFRDRMDALARRMYEKGRRIKETGLSDSENLDDIEREFETCFRIASSKVN